MSKHIVIIGGGPAGVQAATAAATAGASVTVVSDSPVGGRSGWHSLLPSKVWLTAADTFGLLQDADTLGLSLAGEKRPNPEGILARITAVKDSWNGQLAAQLKSLGVEVVSGVGAFASPTEIVVNQTNGETVTHLHPDAVIIAGGSVPFFPEKLRPDGRRVLAPRFASHLAALPASMAVIGAGATGTEFTYLFNRLGVAVTWIVDQFGILPAFDRAVGEFIGPLMAGRGVTLVRDQLADRIERSEKGVMVVLSNGQKIEAEMAFVAIGRFADLNRLNLSAAGLSVEKGKAPGVDGFGQTSVAGIYAVGDAAGVPMLANRAMAQAWVAGKHAAGTDVAPFRAETVVHAIYSEPQVAQVGVLHSEGIRRVTLPFFETLKSHLAPEGEGFITLAFDGNRHVTGGLAVGLHAADVLAPIALAIQVGASLNDLAAVFPAHPTLSELAFMAARQA